MTAISADMASQIKVRQQTPREHPVCMCGCHFSTNGNRMVHFIELRQGNRYPLW